jgi:hypothetical protein
MALNVFPLPTSSNFTTTAVNCASASNLYGGIISLDPGVYSITCVSSTNATVVFSMGEETEVTRATTVSGSVSVNLASPIDRIKVWINTGTNIVVTITRTASAINSSISGTLDTVNNSGTYTGTSTSGYGYVLIAGAGGGGGNASGCCGTGGGSGGVAYGIKQLTGSMSVTIGAAGNAGSAGGTTNFAGMTANGGNGGIANASPYSGGGGNGGTYSGSSTGANGVAGGERGNGGSGSGGVNPSPLTFITRPNIGNAGGGANSGSNPSAGTLSGGGGGAGASNGAAGGAGVVYVLRY